MIFMAEITFGSNFFIGGKSAELNPFSTVSQGILQANRQQKSQGHGAPAFGIFPGVKGWLILDRPPPAAGQMAIKT
jgi:hypothetical protein